MIVENAYERLVLIEVNSVKWPAITFDSWTSLFHAEDNKLIKSKYFLQSILRSTQNERLAVLIGDPENRVILEPKPLEFITNYSECMSQQDQNGVLQKAFEEAVNLMRTSVLTEVSPQLSKTNRVNFADRVKSSTPVRRGRQRTESKEMSVDEQSSRRSSQGTSSLASKPPRGPTKAKTQAKAKGTQVTKTIVTKKKRAVKHSVKKPFKRPAKKGMIRSSSSVSTQSQSSQEEQYEEGISAGDIWKLLKSVGFRIVVTPHDRYVIPGISNSEMIDDVNAFSSLQGIRKYLLENRKLLPKGKLTEAEQEDITQWVRKTRIEEKGCMEPKRPLYNNKNAYNLLYQRGAKYMKSLGSYNGVYAAPGKEAEILKDPFNTKDIYWFEKSSGLREWCCRFGVPGIEDDEHHALTQWASECENFRIFEGENVASRRAGRTRRNNIDSSDHVSILSDVASSRETPSKKQSAKKASDRGSSDKRGSTRRNEASSAIISVADSHGVTEDMKEFQQTGRVHVMSTIEAWRILQRKLKFKFSRQMFMLPGTVAGEHKENVDAFKSVNKLRQHLLEHKIPLPERDTENLLTEEEEHQLRTWLAHTHVPTGDITPLEEEDVRAKLTERGYGLKTGYCTDPNKTHRFNLMQDLQEFCCRNGICGEDNEERKQLALWAAGADIDIYQSEPEDDSMNEITTVGQSTFYSALDNTSFLTQQVNNENSLEVNDHEPMELDEKEPIKVDTQPQMTQPEMTQPEITQPEITQPQSTQPEITQPEPEEEGPTSDQILNECIERLHPTNDASWAGNGSREEQIDTITKFLQTACRTNGYTDGDTPSSSPVLHICGGPGTGKTSTIRQCMASLKSWARVSDFARSIMEHDPVPELKFLNVAHTRNNRSNLKASILQSLNEACDLPDSNEDFEKIQHRLDFEQTSQRHKNRTVILILDEIDLILTNRSSSEEDLLTKLINFSCNVDLTFCLVLISNKVDLRSDLLKDAEKVVFPSYKKEDLFKIVQHKLPQPNIIQEAGLEFACRKVGATSGDVRQLMELLSDAINNCKRSLEMEKSSRPTFPLVKIGHIMQAVKSTVGSKYGDRIAALPEGAKIVLCVAVTLGKALGPNSRVTMPELRKYCIIGFRSGLFEHMSVDDFLTCLDMLLDNGLLLLDGEHHLDRYSQSYGIGVQLEDVEVALGELISKKEIYGNIAREVLKSVRR